MTGLSKILLAVSNLDANFVNKHARIPGGSATKDIKFEVEFRPEEGMSGYQAAVAMAIIANVLSRNEPMSPEEFDSLPDEVAQFFHKVDDASN
jgi:hypothetical protein